MQLEQAADLLYSVGREDYTRNLANGDKVGWSIKLITDERYSLYLLRKRIFSILFS